MSNSRDRQIVIELVVQSGQSNLLQGLDAWLQLGLISDAAVRRLCQEKLVCPLPELAVVSAAEEANQFASLPAAGSFLPPEPDVRVARSSRPPTIVAQAMQSLMAEISVVWLLFLGVFLVVVSSAVLAATQWRQVSPVGQYGILFGYTVVFWFASQWTRRRPALQLTSRMLTIATLLIIPVNFWTMDGFRLWNSGTGIGVSAIASLILTAITFSLLKSSSTTLTIVAAIALGYLHWGWSQPGIPFFATYVGTIGAAIVLLLQDRRQEVRGKRQEENHASRSALSTQHSALSTSLSTIAIALSTLLLIFRALFVAEIPPNQLGLAIGVCGWLLCWLARRERSRTAWARAGGVLLIVGWLLTVTVIPPWQAVAISGLGLWLLIDALWRSGQLPYLTVSWLVGLQLVWLLWRLVPATGQQQIISACMRLAGGEGMPYALSGVGFLPYVLLTIGFSFQLRRWQRSALAHQAELLALVLGSILTAISLSNPLVRSLNLTLSALTLVAVAIGRDRPHPFLVYLTHGAALAAVFSWIDRLFPTLNSTTWAAVLLAIMAVEWLLAATWRESEARHEARGRREGETRGNGAGEMRGGFLSPQSSALGAQHTSPLHRFTPSPPLFASHLSTLARWQVSAWHFGILLALASYLLLLYRLEGNDSWNLMWLSVPILLTGLAYRDRFPPWRVAGWLSLLALVVVQPLTFDSSGNRLASLGIATGLMLLNTRRLQQGMFATLTVGFGIGFWTTIVREMLGDRLNAGSGSITIALTVLGLWSLRGVLQLKRTHLAQLYRCALDGWTIAVLLLAFLVLSLSQLLVYFKWENPNWQYVLASGLLVAATSVRNWQGASNAGWWAISWSVELLAASGLSLTGRSLDQLAIVNITLGFLTQLAGDWWIRRGRQRAEGGGQRDDDSLSSFIPDPSSLHFIPLLYATLGVLLQHRSLTATTGLFTLAGALVGIGIGRRLPSLKPITYLALLGVSLAAYELLIYQLSQAKGGYFGDGVVLLAALAVVIAIAYQLLQRWLLPYLQLTLRELRLFAHGHWILGNVFLLGAATSPLSQTGRWWWAAIAALLAAYALASGNEYWYRHEARGAGDTNPESQIPTSLSPLPPPPSLSTQHFWTYAGILETLIALTALLRLQQPDALLLDWAGTIAIVIAVVFYFVPWQHWGWQQEPWRHSATILPGVAVLLSAWGSNLQSLLIVAAYYAWLSVAERQIRWSYLSVLLADWAIVRLLHFYNATELLWYIALLSGSLLYLAQVDPAFEAQHSREQRHWLRCLATGLLCLTAFYQSEVGLAGLAPIVAGFVAIALQFGFALAGLFQRVRAFLYVGTLTFMVQVLWQLWRFVSDYSLLLWTLGIVVGLILIWVAATFEARRAQVNTLLQHWIAELEGWQ